MREADIGSHPLLLDRERMSTKLADDDENADMISVYDDIDEQAVNNYYGLNQATSAAIRQPRAANDYDILGAADTDKSTEHIETSELDADNNDQAAVSTPLVECKLIVLILICLNHLYTANSKPAGAMQLRHRGHNFLLPVITLEFNKRHFIARALLKYI